MCGLFWGAHKSLAPTARTLLCGLGRARLSFFAVATLLFVFFGECPEFCDLAKQRREILGGVSEVGKDDFSLYFFWRCVIFLVFYFSSAAIARRSVTALLQRISGLSFGNEMYSTSMSLHSSFVIPSSVCESSSVLASFLARVDERRSVRSLAGGVGLRTGLTFELLD